MSRINVPRLLMGGLVAGIVDNGLDFVINPYLVANENNVMMQRMNLRSDVAENSMWPWIAVDFIYGFILVFAYVAMRPRFGPGPKTAMITGMTFWIAFTAVFAGLMSMGLYSPQHFGKNSFYSLVSTLLPVLVGAALYKEDEA